MIRAASLFVFLSVASAAAEPVSLSCKVIGAHADFWGPVVVTVDETARHVRVDIPKWPQFHNEYVDGAVGPIIRGSNPYWDDPGAAVEQFVRLTPTQLEFGWRSVEDGKLEHFVWIDRAALSRRVPCRFHAHWNFGVG